MATKTVVLFLQKTTKGAAMYQQVDGKGQPMEMKDNDAVFPTVYMRKLALGEQIPNTVTITVNYD